MLPLRRALSSSAKKKNASVLVVGGGPAGLTSALYLARYGVRTTLVEPRLTPSEHPRAHVVGARSMEIFSGVGVAPAILEKVSDVEMWRRFRYSSSLDAADDLAVADHGSSDAWRNLQESSSCQVAHVSQPHLERALRAQIEQVKKEGAPLETIYGKRVIKVEQSLNGVQATLDDGTSLQTEWCIGADGASGPVRREMQRGWLTRRPSTEEDQAEARALRSLGIVVESGGDRAPALQTFVSIHFESAELARQLKSRPAMLYFVLNPSCLAVVVAHDLKRGVFNLQRPLFAPWELSGDACAPAAVERAVREVLSTTELPSDLEVHSARSWAMHARIDLNMRQKRLFLAGDAAHEMPPSGGLGMNTAVQDAHNLAWKLAIGDEQLLETYSSERRAAAASNVALSLDNWRRGLLVPAALGLHQENLDQFSTALRVCAPAVLSETTARRAFETATSSARNMMLLKPKREALATLVGDRKELPLFFPKADLGFVYNGSTPLEAATQALTTARDPKGSAGYKPSFAAGCRLPHFVDSLTGLPSLKLIEGPSNTPPRFTLLATTAASEEACREAAASSSSERLVVVRVNIDGIEEGAAILVRPDGHIARYFRPEELTTQTLKGLPELLYMTPSEPKVTD